MIEIQCEFVIIVMAVQDWQTWVWFLGSALVPGPCACLNTGMSITDFRLSQFCSKSKVPPWFTQHLKHILAYTDIMELAWTSLALTWQRSRGGSWWGSPAAGNSQEQIWGVLLGLPWLQGSHTLKDIITGIKPQHIKPRYDFTGSCTMALLATRQRIIRCPGRDTLQWWSRSMLQDGKPGWAK